MFSNSIHGPMMPWRGVEKRLDAVAHLAKVIFETLALQLLNA